MKCPGPSGDNPEPTSITRSPMGRLSELMSDNDRLMDELAENRLRIDEARKYLEIPGCSARFGEAHLERCRAKHSGILARLRENRLEALRLLGEGGA